MENILFSKPKLIASAHDVFVEGREKFGNCLRGCKWSPDGTCIATNSEDHKIRLFNTPNIDWEQLNNESYIPLFNLNHDLQFRESQIIYDFAWYPYMRSDDPSTCFLVTASKGVPLHLWDAYSGKIHLSFKAQNAVDELASSRCVEFMSCGTKLVAGYEKFLTVFNLSRPGEPCDYIYDLPTGMLSCITVCESLFALGTFNKMITLFDTKTNENIVTIQGHKGGVTHLSLSPDGQKLFSGARRDGEILCWDLRNYGNILHTITRKCFTNQRIYFDINHKQNILVTGNSSGSVQIYNLDSLNEKLSHSNEFIASNCCTNGVSIHPTLPILGTTSGERILLEFNDNDENVIFNVQKNFDLDQSLKFWTFK